MALLIDVNSWVALACRQCAVSRPLQLALYYHISASFNVADRETSVKHIRCESRKLFVFWKPSCRRPDRDPAFGKALFLLKVFLLASVFNA